MIRTYKNTTIYRSGGWWKAEVRKAGLVGYYYEPLMADTLQGIKNLITQELSQ